MQVKLQKARKKEKKLKSWYNKREKERLWAKSADHFLVRTKYSHLSFCLRSDDVYKMYLHNKGSSSVDEVFRKLIKHALFRHRSWGRY